eukprot:1138782-Pelagomonas_calceolata.AAC.2
MQGCCKAQVVLCSALRIEATKAPSNYSCSKQGKTNGSSVMYRSCLKHLRRAQWASKRAPVRRTEMHVTEDEPQST